MDSTQATQNLPEPGQLRCTVRQRHFVVLDVQKSTLPADPVSFRRPDSAAPSCCLNNCVEDDALGEELL